MIPAHIYNDKELFELEKERLFSRSWMFVAHESEIPQDGDYVVRRVLDDSFIVTRDSTTGDVRAMFNMCLHRGMQVCRAEMGNASNFRCPYHGWTYRNDGRLTGLPFHRDAYGGDEGFPKSSQTLLARTDISRVYNGLIFVNMDPHAQPLSRLPRRLSVLSGLLHQAEHQRTPGAWPAAMANQGQLEDRRRELRRGHVPHPAHPRFDRRDRTVPGAESAEA